MTYLDTPEDMKWLKEVHTKLAAAYDRAILYGNEDSPSRVELYARDHFKCKPTVLEPDEKGVLRVKSWGERSKTAHKESERSELC